mmetsp:Transcript_8136/g.29567  ORF Transcript_8136/g.29567 Transcript_8136/m.29567 type:complete len:456 (+) Transcript_8136:167-1534(+)
MEMHMVRAGVARVVRPRLRSTCKIILLVLEAAAATAAPRGGALSGPLGALPPGPALLELLDPPPGLLVGLLLRGPPADDRLLRILGQHLAPTFGPKHALELVADATTAPEIGGPLRASNLQRPHVHGLDGVVAAAVHAAASRDLARGVHHEGGEVALLPLGDAGVGTFSDAREVGPAGGAPGAGGLALAGLQDLHLLHELLAHKPRDEAVTLRAEGGREAVVGEAPGPGGLHTEPRPVPQRLDDARRGLAHHDARVREALPPDFHGGRGAAEDQAGDGPRPCRGDGVLEAGLSRKGKVAEGALLRGHELVEGRHLAAVQNVQGEMHVLRHTGLLAADRREHLRVHAAGGQAPVVLRDLRPKPGRRRSQRRKSLVTHPLDGPDFEGGAGDAARELVGLAALVHPLAQRHLHDLHRRTPPRTGLGDAPNGRCHARVEGVGHWRERPLGLVEAQRLTP